ncbi:MAG: cob(I)yrinic acid a,c-diamide adenosyltransferase [Euryarchaeota archaeon]|jgi:cob(I)alamin adenosyltransferase|nr:cob(I)yrinic acid a,c-diamide adenosyltransferase [Euryarchaeota archaeon]
MLQVYTGNGKGKTTAAFGLAMRAKGRGKKVGIVQFAKPEESGEFKIARDIGIDIFHFGYPGFIIKSPREGDYTEAMKAWEKFIEMSKDGYDLIILDELNIVLYYNLLDLNNVIETLMRLKNDFEIVVTGRYAKDDLIKISDLVTEMCPLKHYFDIGVGAREGIEF